MPDAARHALMPPYYFRRCSSTLSMPRGCPPVTPPLVYICRYDALRCRFAVMPPCAPVISMLLLRVAADFQILPR